MDANGGNRQSDNGMNLRRVIKKIAQGISLVIVFPSALLCGFGRFSVLYTFFAHLFAILPGIVGDFFRSAYYKYTLQECSLETVISFGTFFSRRNASVGQNVSIGSFCVIGCVRIGPRTQIASHVEIPGGRHQHARVENGRLLDPVDEVIVIGADCWIGAAAIIMANVGMQSTIGAGSVVVKDIPARVVAVGVPAKPIKNSVGTSEDRSVID
jgi:virginiamycin A acetyltransferase